LKALQKQRRGEIGVFFIDDNFAINPRRTKALLREIIGHDAQLPWIAQISMNLLRDEELVSLIAQSGGRWIFMGLESIDPESLKSVRKTFNKPAEYDDVLQLLARHGLYAITSFIFGMDGDRSGIADRTLEQIHSWPPGLPVFGLLTPYPATPLYDRLAAAGRLTRPKHWLDFKPFVLAHSPLGLTADEAKAEVCKAWEASYSPAAIGPAMDWLQTKPLAHRTVHLGVHLLFRGVYFPQMKWHEWLHVLFQNRHAILRVIGQVLEMKFRPHQPETLAIRPQEASD